MMLEAGLFAQLTGDAGVAALVGTRVYPILLPQEPTLPAVTFQRISTRDEYALDGIQCLSTVRMQIDCYARTLQPALALEAAVRDAIDGQQATWGTVVVQAVRRVNEQAFYDPSIEASRVTSDFLITFVDD